MNADHVEEVVELSAEEVVAPEVVEAPQIDARTLRLMRKQLAKANEQSVTIQKRRKANKLARKQRRVNRQNNHRKGHK